MSYFHSILIGNLGIPCILFFTFIAGAETAKAMQVTPMSIELTPKPTEAARLIEFDVTGAAEGALIKAKPVVLFMNKAGDVKHRDPQPDDDILKYVSVREIVHVSKTSHRIYIDVQFPKKFARATKIYGIHIEPDIKMMRKKSAPELGTKSGITFAFNGTIKVLPTEAAKETLDITVLDLIATNHGLFVKTELSNPTERLIEIRSEVLLRKSGGREIVEKSAIFRRTDRKLSKRTNLNHINVYPKTTIESYIPVVRASAPGSYDLEISARSLKDTFKRKLTKKISISPELAKINEGYFDLSFNPGKIVTRFKPRGANIERVKVTNESQKDAAISIEIDQKRLPKGVTVEPIPSSFNLAAGKTETVRFKITNNTLSDLDLQDVLSFVAKDKDKKEILKKSLTVSFIAKKDRK